MKSAGHTSGLNVLSHQCFIGFNTNGTLDTGFGNGGYVFNDKFYDGDCAFLFDCYIYLVSNYCDSGMIPTTALSRFNLDGSVDSSFEYDGKFCGSPYDLPYMYYIPTEMLILNDDRIIVAGAVHDGWGGFGPLFVQQFGQSSMLPVEVEQTKQHEFIFTCFPNPATTELQVNCWMDQPGSLLITDIFGKPQTEAMLPQNASSIRMNVTSLVPGIYFLNVITQYDVLLTTKLIVER